MDIHRTTVAKVAKSMIGTPFRIEQTGGGCEALVATLEGGWTVVLCANLSVPQWGDEGTSAALYAPGAWDDGGRGAERNEWSEAPLSPVVVRMLVGSVL